VVSCNKQLQEALNEPYVTHTQFSLFAKRNIAQNNGRFISTRMVYLCIHPDYHRRLFLLVPGPSFLVSTSNPKPGPLFQYGAPPFKLAPPRITRTKSRACLPRLQLRNVCYNKTTLRSGCTLFLTRVSNVTVRLSANDSRVAKASAQRRVSRSTRDTPRTLKSVYL